jgi:gamma-glutamyltranspeptidase/glutathione hydrolase
MTIHYHSRRSPIYCTNGCVATSQPLATSIGLHVLRGLGGNAADASVAISAALAVLEPCSTGLGGDMFALWYDAKAGEVSAINGSGRSPMCGSSIRDVELAHPPPPSSSLTSTIEERRNELHARFARGVHSITIPGAAMGWQDVHSKYGSGKLTLSELLMPAIDLAEKGFPVAPMTSMAWRAEMDKVTRWHDDGGLVELGVDGTGAGPSPGQIFRNPHMARVLRSLGEYGAKNGFYDGFPGRSIVDAIRKRGGKMTHDDMSNHASSFPEPICVEYRGMKLWEVPPNGQGVAGLIALRGLESLEVSGMIRDATTSSSRRSHASSTSTSECGNGNADAQSPSSSSSSTSDAIKGGSPSTNHNIHPQPSFDMLHAQIEMMRLGFDDARSYVCDPDRHHASSNHRVECTTDWLLDEERIASRALDSFDGNRAVMQGRPDSTSCTVSFQVVDGEGNAISFVNRCVCARILSISLSVSLPFFSGERALIRF